MSIRLEFWVPIRGMRKTLNPIEPMIEPIVFAA